ncbi:MAG: hypothetical protein IKF99_01120 [Oscillospiraceae bacterium]|nr:hypothetical protein [Oscillospiraceae bacterium]
MTEAELKQVRYIKNEIEIYRQQLRELRQQSMTGGRRLDGMPRAGRKGDKVAERAISAADLEREISGLMDRLIRAEIETMRYIEAAPASLERQVLYMRYVVCMPWGQIATKIGGGNTADSCRKIAKRYIRANS